MKTHTRDTPSQYIVPAIDCALEHYIAAMRASLAEADRAPTTRSGLLTALRGAGWEDETLLARVLPALEAALGIKPPAGEAIPQPLPTCWMTPSDRFALNLAGRGLLLRFGEVWRCQNDPLVAVDADSVDSLTAHGLLAVTGPDSRGITNAGRRRLARIGPRTIPPVAAAAIADLHRRAAP